MGTKKSSRRQMATLLCSLGAIVIGGVAADAMARAYVHTNGIDCDAYIPNGNGGFTQVNLAHCTGTTWVCECSVTTDAQGNVTGFKGSCCPRP